MTDVEVFVDPSCPWAWITSRSIKEVAPQRDLVVVWRSYCLEIRDDYGVAPTMPAERREAADRGPRPLSSDVAHFRGGPARAGEDAVDALFNAWGPRFFVRDRAGDDELLLECLAACDADPDLLRAANDEKWDAPILESMTVAYAFGGPKTQTPTIVVRADEPFGFKGPVMAPAADRRGRASGCGTRST